MTVAKKRDGTLSVGGGGRRPAGLRPQRPFVIFGHRGSPRAARENTIASFDAAAVSGCGFETDVRRLADGELVLFHDRTVGGKPVESMTYTDLTALSGDVARLEELARYSGRVPMDIEVKESGLEKELIEVTAGWKGVVVSSFRPEVLAVLSEAGCLHSLGLIADRDIASMAALAAEMRLRYFFPRYPHVHRELVEKLHAAEVAVVPWSPNRAEWWGEVLEAGCDGMITDVPALAAQWLTGRLRATNVLNSAP